MKMLPKFIFFILFFLISCNKKKDFLDIKIIGHAGNGLENTFSVYHDNSKEAIELALSYEGCDGVELDVQLSKSGSLWLYHDENLSSQTNGSDCISNLYDDKLKTFIYKGLNKEKLIKLVQIPKLILSNKVVFLDLRHYNYCNNQIIDLNKMIERIKYFKEIYQDVEINVITNLSSWISELNNIGVNVFYSKENEDIKNLVNNNFIDGIVFKNKEVDKSMIMLTKSYGKKVAIFEVRSPKMIRDALRKRPDYIITDDVKASIIEKY